MKNRRDGRTEAEGMDRGLGSTDRGRQVGPSAEECDPTAPTVPGAGGGAAAVGRRFEADAGRSLVMVPGCLAPGLS